ncbi:hypothetical protein, partial [Mycolicibacterium sp. P9-22]|uniref:hypothetical protein n=1 Tax=Mycolicibacterium sp. P9-22 TaxID=2024613 RepID=UPI001D1582DB
STDTSETYRPASSKPSSTLRNGPTNPWSKSNSESLHQDQGDSHLAESSIGHYVTNGQLIAAALIAGYPMREAGGPNPLFGMRKRDLDRAEAAVNAKR